MNQQTARRGSAAWALVITSVAGFMAALDNLVVTTALPSIREDLGGGLHDLEWTVSAYTLTFAVLLMFGAALGDRFGRRRLFVTGLAVFTGASAAAALAPGIDALIAARAVQGVGAAIMMPLTLTLLTAAVPAARRGMAFGIWGAVNGLAVAAGPLIGGTLTEHMSWQWIFWLNVPLGLAWFALVLTPDASYAAQLPALVVSGIGMALYFAPAANLVMSSVRPSEQGIASGANNALREVGGALGVAVMASIFTAQGGYESGQSFVDGLVPALWVGAGAVALGAVAVLFAPSRRQEARRKAETESEVLSGTPSEVGVEAGKPGLITA